MTIEQIYKHLRLGIERQIEKGADWDYTASTVAIDNDGHGIVVWCDTDADGKYFDITIREDYSKDGWGKTLGMLEACTATDTFEDLESNVVKLLNEFYESRKKISTNNTYGCDICGNRKDWDYGIVWITSSYGVCYECYNKLSREDLERIRKEYE